MRGGTFAALHGQTPRGIVWSVSLELQSAHAVSTAGVVADDEQLVRVRELFTQVELQPRDADVATSFNRAIVELARRPSAEVARFLAELSDHVVLGRARDQNGWPCRAAVLSTRLELGYPWALEVDPDELSYVREHSPDRVSGWLSATFVTGVTSALLAMLPLLFVFPSANGWDEVLIVGALVAMTAFGGVAALVARQALRGARLPRWFGAFGAVGALVPLVAILSTLDTVAVCLAIGLAPHVVTSVSALLAGATARR